MPKLDSKYRTECALSIAVLGVIGSRLPVPCAPVLKTGPRISNPSQADQPRKLSFYSLKSPYIALSDDVRRCLETHRDLVLVLRLTVCYRFGASVAREWRGRQSAPDYHCRPCLCKELLRKPSRDRPIRATRRVPHYCSLLHHSFLLRSIPAAV
jgi:hypothetical protein